MALAENKTRKNCIDSLRDLLEDIDKITQLIDWLFVYVKTKFVVQPPRVPAPTFSVIDDFGLGNSQGANNGGVGDILDEPAMPIRKISNVVNGAAAALLKRATEEGAEKRKITIEKSVQGGDGAKEDNILNRLKKREHIEVELQTLIQQDKEKKRESKFDKFA
jgi:hypothetical protein